MNTKNLSRCAGVFVMSMLIASTAIAQEHGYRQQGKPSAVRVLKNIKNSDYSYSIFSTPDNALGFAVFQKGTQVFQQLSLKFLASDGRMYYLNNVEVGKAAAFTIQKIQKRKFPLLSIGEIKKIAMQ